MFARAAASPPIAPGRRIRVYVYLYITAAMSARFRYSCIRFARALAATAKYTSRSWAHSCMYAHMCVRVRVFVRSSCWRPAIEVVTSAGKQYHKIPMHAPLLQLFVSQIYFLTEIHFECDVCVSVRCVPCTRATR